MIDLQGKKGIVFGIANDKSMAYGCAKALCSAGAEIIVPYHQDKTKKYVEPLLQNLRVAKFMQCDASKEEELQAVMIRYLEGKAADHSVLPAHYCHF